MADEVLIDARLGTDKIKNDIEDIAATLEVQNNKERARDQENEEARLRQKKLFDEQMQDLEKELEHINKLREQGVNIESYLEKTFKNRQTNLEFEAQAKRGILEIVKEQSREEEAAAKREAVRFELARRAQLGSADPFASLRGATVPTVGGGESKGFVAGLQEGLTELLGGGQLGEMATAVATGTVAFEAARLAVDFLVESLKSLAEWTKETIEEADALANRYKALNALAAEYGQSAESMIETLRESTHGLLPDSDLVISAQKLLAANINLTKEEIEKLYKVTTDYSLLTGKGVPESLETLTTALQSGRFQMVAHRLELQASTRALIADTEGMETNARQREQALITMRAIEDQLSRMGGAPELSLMNVTEQVSSTLSNMREEFGKTIVESDLYRDAAKDLKSALDELKPIGMELAHIFGVLLVNGIDTGTKALNLFAGPLKGTLGTIKDYYESIASYGLGDKPPAQLQPPRPPPLVEEREIDPQTKRKLEQSSLNVTKEFVELEFNIKKDALAREKQLIDEQYKYGDLKREEYLQKQRQQADDEYRISLQKVNTQKAIEQQLLTLQFPQADKDPTQAQQLADKQKSLETKTKQEILQLDAKYRDERFKIEQSITADQAKADQVRLEQALVEQKRILDVKVQAVEQEFALGKTTQDELTKVQRDAISVRKSLAEAAAVQTLARSPGGGTTKAAQEEFVAAYIKAGHDAEQAAVALQDHLTEIAQKGAQIRAASEIDMDQMKSKAELAANEYRYQQEQISVNDILELRVAAVARQGELDLAQAALKHSVIEKSVAEDARYAAEKVKIAEETKEKIDAIIRTTPEVLLADQDKKYQERVRELQAQGNVPGGQSEALQKQITLEQDRIGTLKGVIEALKEDNALRREQLVLLDQAKARLVDLKNAQVTIKDELSNTFDILSRGLSKFDKSRNIAGALGNASDQIYASESYKRQARTVGFVEGSSAQNSPFAGLFEAFKQNAEGTKTGAEKLKQFNTALAGAVASVGSLIAAFANAKSGASGALGGGLAASSFARDLSSIKGLAFLGGPIAQIAIGAVGAIFGGIIGAAKKHTEEAAKKLSDSFEAVTKALSNGSVKLSDAIDQAAKIRQQTVQDLSGRKGGREQLDKLLPGMDSAIEQLKKKQKDLIKSLNKDLETLRAPEALSGVINSIDAIIDKYKDYDGAIGGVSDATKKLQDAQVDLAKAEVKNAAISNLMGDKNLKTEEYTSALQRAKDAQENLTAATEEQGKAQEFLNLSVQRFIDQENRELRSAEQSAIENAIQLNDLYDQRKDILDQSAKAEYDVLTRGVLTRQRTNAQTKGSEIDDIRKQRDKDLESINKQIELSQFRLTAEKQIFNLASDRIGLEHQLLDKQKATIIEDVNRLTLIQSVISSLGSHNITLADLQTLIKNMGSKGYLSSAEDQYSRYGRNGYAGYNGEL